MTEDQQRLTGKQQQVPEEQQQVTGDWKPTMPEARFVAGFRIVTGGSRQDGDRQPLEMVTRKADARGGRTVLAFRLSQAERGS